MEKKQQLLSDIVKGFFCGFLSGVLDRRQPSWRFEQNSKLVKQVIADYFDCFAVYFCNVTFPIILSSNFNNYEEAQLDMSRHHFSDETPVKMLMRYACQSKELYDFMVEIYQKEMIKLLEGNFTGEIDNTDMYYQRAVLEGHQLGFNEENKKS